MYSSSDKRLSVCVIIPTYNRADFIRAALDSALSQTRIPDEIIVVNDGSTDDTDCVLDQYGPPVRVIRQTNRGRSVARNVGLSQTTCDAVMFLDSDDLLMPRNIEVCAEALEQHPEVGVVYTDAYLIDPHDDRIGVCSEILPGPRPSGMVLGELARRSFLTVSSMVRRSLVAESGFEEGVDLCEDYDLWRRLAAKCQFRYVDEPLMCYRFHESMTVSTRLVEMLDAELNVQRRIMEMREFNDLPRRERARAFCSHGAKNAMLGKSNEARRYFFRAIRVSPTYLGGHVLTALSLLGTRALQFAILKRREAIGNQIGARFGAEALSRQRTASCTDRLPSATCLGANTVSKGGAR